MSRALARGLADLGVGEGDIVAVWLGNRPEWVTTQLAASYLGTVIVAVNIRYRTHELEYMLRDSGTSVLVTKEYFLGNDYLAMTSEVVTELRTETASSFNPVALDSLDHVVGMEADADFPAVRADGDVLADGDANGIEPATDPTARPPTSSIPAGRRAIRRLASSRTTRSSTTPSGWCPPQCH